MPIYEFECRACRQRFEKLQSISDDPIRVCPTCGGETRRVLQPVGVIFKGSGWYITDSRKSKSASTGSSSTSNNTSNNSTSESSGSSSSDSSSSSNSSSGSSSSDS